MSGSGSDNVASTSTAHASLPEEVQRDIEAVFNWNLPHLHHFPTIRVAVVRFRTGSAPSGQTLNCRFTART